MNNPAKRLRYALLVALVSAALTGCAPEAAGTTRSAAARRCGTVNVAMNAWVGYEADAAVVGYLAKTRLGCTVVEKDLTEEDSWKGFATGSVDVILENRGHDDLKRTYIDAQKVAVESGETGNKGVIGWYVPPWMAQKYPDITDWQNLNKYADLFKTAQSGGKGQFLDGDPSLVTNDQALLVNLGLSFNVSYAGSETALIEAFRGAEEHKKPLLGHFYQPQWFMAQVKLVHIDLPPYTPGCDADKQKVACDYQPFDLDKIVSRRFADSGSPAVNLIKNFRWTNDDQNEVAYDLAANKLSPDEAGKKWVDAHPDAAGAWLDGG